MEIQLNTAIKDEHGNLVEKIVIDENITCGDIIDVGDCATENELYIRLASRRSDLSYEDLRKLDVNSALKLIVAIKRVLNGVGKPSPEKPLQDSAESQDKA